MAATKLRFSRPGTEHKNGSVPAPTPFLTCDTSFPYLQRQLLLRVFVKLPTLPHRTGALAASLPRIYPTSPPRTATLRKVLVIFIAFQPASPFVVMPIADPNHAGSAVFRSFTTLNPLSTFLQ